MISRQASRRNGRSQVSGHAYSLLDCVKLASGAHLVQLRNPWGRFEWTGAWSDADPRWPSEMKQKVASSIGVDASEIIKDGDGAFWMAYEDFVRYFAKFSVALQRSPSSKPWSEARCRGAVTVLGRGWRD